MKKLMLLAITSLIASPALAQFGNNCIWKSGIHHVRGYTSRSIIIRAMDGTYEAGGSFCWGLNFARQIKLDSWSSFDFCEGDTIITERDRCRVDFIRKIGY